MPPWPGCSSAASSSWAMRCGVSRRNSPPTVGSPILSLANRRGVPVVEDAAQAHGASTGGQRVGSLGKLGCFSFYPTKNLGALGDGGIIVTDDPALAERARAYRNYGQRERYLSTGPGINSRLDEL